MEPEITDIKQELPQTNKPITKSKPPIKPIYFLVLFLLISFISAFIIGGFVLGNNSTKQKACTMEAKICPDGSSVGRSGPNCEFASCPTPKPDTTASWKTYFVKEIGLSYSVPINFPDLVQKNGEGVSGTQIYIIPDPSESYQPIALGTSSTDYIGGSDLSFAHLQGFYKNGSKYFARFESNSSSFEIPNELANEITNINGIKILIVKGKNTTAPEGSSWPIIGTPGEGYIGALINTNSKTYPGFTISMELSSKDTAELFNQILSTFKFTDQISPTPTAKPKTNNLKLDSRCKIGGCSGEICQSASSEPAISTCIYKAEYACYKEARCEIQTNGQCGWTMGEDLKSCLQGAK